MVWRRVVWTIQLVVFLTAGFFATPLTPVARPLQNATAPVATATLVTTRSPVCGERTGERAARIRKTHTGDAIALTPTVAPVVGPAGFIVEAARVRVPDAPRLSRFTPHAPRGPPQLG